MNKGTKRAVFLDLNGTLVMPIKVSFLSDSDVLAAKSFGGLGCFVKTGWGKKKSELEAARPYADFIGSNLDEVADWILSTNDL